MGFNRIWTDLHTKLKSITVVNKIFTSFISVKVTKQQCKKYSNVIKSLELTCVQKYLHKNLSKLKTHFKQ